MDTKKTFMLTNQTLQNTVLYASFLQTLKIILIRVTLYWGFPGGSDSKDSVCNAGESLDQEDPLEKGMTPHSSILAWGIPWIEEPGGLLSMGSHRVGHD